MFWSVTFCAVETDLHLVQPSADDLPRCLRKQARSVRDDIGMRDSVILCEQDFVGQQLVQERFAEPVQMRDGLAALAGRFFNDLLKEPKVHEAAFSR